MRQNMKRKKGDKFNIKIIDFDEQEYELLKKYFFKRSLYKKEIISNYISYYRSKVNSNVGKVDLVTGVTIITKFIGANKLDDAYGYNYLITVIVAYLFYKSISDIILILKGKRGLYERLEKMLSKLYNECINESYN